VSLKLLTARGDGTWKPRPPELPQPASTDALSCRSCAARRSVISPAQPGGTRREVPGSDGWPGPERGRGQ